ncbi:hypothetical protein MMC30_008821 [Trapelia coarctata]|nr:hypothetical protein [Trapelia coarctata]
MIITPRFHLLELGDQSWCPEWLREYSHLARIQMWKTEAPGGRGSPAAQVCDLLDDNLPDASSFTYIDSCAGGGGPIPIMEATLNQKLRFKGQGPVKFILTDLFPAVAAWKAIAKQSDNISYIEEPVDATKALRLAEPGKKECRIFNLCFHHFDDPAAKTVLRSAVESADAFVYVLDTPNLSFSLPLPANKLLGDCSIFEMTHRNLLAFLNTTFIVLSPFLTTFLWFRYSPLHLFFTYLIPIVPLFFAVDGYVSCIRGRTPEELGNLLQSQSDLDLSGWKFKSGEKMVLPPFGKMYWYMGVKEKNSG